MARLQSYYMVPEERWAEGSPGGPASLELTEEVVEHYLSLSEKAADRIAIAPPARTHLRRVSADFLDMARRYLADGRHFQKRGDLLRAFGCAYYAHAWLDAGARLGLFDVGEDDSLFTLVA